MADAVLTVTRDRVALRSSGRHRAWKWWYYVRETPDGQRFDNDSIVTLRQVLRRHYGRDVTIVEAWKAAS